jgi:hypothetical protein
VLNTESLKSVSEGEGDGIPTLSKTRLDDQGKGTEIGEEIPLNIKSTSAEQGNPLKITWSDKKKKGKGGRAGNRPLL